MDRVQRLAAQCGSVKTACQELGIAPATYYRYRKCVGGHVRPALRKDWNQLAREWECSIFGQLSPVDARHLRYDAAAAVGRCFGLPSHARETDIRDQLRRLDKALCEVFDTYDDIGRDARGLVDEIHGSTGTQPSFASLMDRLRPLARQVTELAKGMEEIAEETGAARGGRDYDSRIDGLVVALASLYARRIREPPCHTISPDDGEPSSEFNIFVDDVFRYFLPELEVPEHVFDTYDDIGRDARGLVDEIHGSTGTQPSFASLMDRLRPLARQVTELAKGMEEIAEETGAARGGRDYDSRIDGLVVALASLYARRIREPPCHTISPDDGEPSSEFNIFVDDVFRYFLPELEVPPNALIEAMRHAAARIDYSDDIERRD